MLAIVCASLICFAAEPDKELKAKLDAISKQLSSAKLTDRLAGLDAAAKLEGDAITLVPKIAELAMDLSSRHADKAAESLKPISPKLFDATLKMREALKNVPVAGVALPHFEIIAGLGNDAQYMMWAVYLHLSQNASRNISSKEIAEKGLNLLCSLDDESETHFQLAQKSFAKMPEAATPSLMFFADKKKEKRAEVVKLIGPRLVSTAKGIDTLAGFGKDAKSMLPALKKIATLNPDKSLREAAEVAVEVIEKAAKE